MEKKYLTTKEAAKYLTVGKTMLENWRRQGTGPAYIRVGPQTIRYDRHQLDQYMCSNNIGETPTWEND